MLHRIRRSLAAKLILASALPSAAVLVTSLWVLVRHTRATVAQDPVRALDVLGWGALIGGLITLTFAATAIALVTRQFLVKPIERVLRVMKRAESGDFLVRAKVDSEDELGVLSRSFNTMLSRVTDMAVEEIETQRSLEDLQRELALKAELQEANARLADHVREMQLVLEVASALGSTLDLTEQLEQLGRNVCSRLSVNEFSVMLVDETTQQLVIEAVAGDAPATARGLRFHLGEGVTGAAAAQGATQVVQDVTQDARYLHYKGQRVSTGSFVSIPLRAKGKVVGVMNLNRPQKDAFAAQEIRLAEAIAVHAALAIVNARLYAQMTELSYTDPLTGIPNRRALFQRLDHEWTRSLRFGDELSLLMIDLDLFKQVNDAFGHAVGDQVLRAIALLLRRNVRKVDMVARYGGEEFCVVLPRIGKHEALEVAEKLRRVVAQGALPTAPGHAPLQLTISVGVASYGGEVHDVAGLLEKADQALYEAKRAGRNAVAGSPDVPPSVPPAPRVQAS